MPDSCISFSKNLMVIVLQNLPNVDRTSEKNELTASCRELKPCGFMIWNLWFHELNCPISSMPQAIHAPQVQFMAQAIHAHRAIHCTPVHPRDNKKCPTGVEHFLYLVKSKLYSLRASPLARWCFALCFAFRKTLAEQSALARLQASLQTRFVWLSWISWVR